MTTVILPGYSEHNKVWAEETAEKLQAGGVQTIVYSWKHWDGKTEFNAQNEVIELIKLIGNEKVNIVAKSIGTYITVILISKIPDKLGKVIICGVPVNDLSESENNEYKALVNFDQNNMLCFQNKDDKHGSFEKIQSFLKEINTKIEVIEKTGDTHEYPYFGEFRKFLVEI